MNQRLAWASLGGPGVGGAPVPFEIGAMKKNLPEREFLVLALRFGLEGNEPHKLSEIAQKIGVSNERVRQIEYKAFRALRR